jgi:dynein heavy chain
MPLIKIMCNPGFKDRHWEQISQIIGKPINASENIKLNTMISKNIFDFFQA